MAINFPDSPSVNDTHTVGDRTWVWDGTTWTVIVGGVPTSISEFSVTGDLNVGQNAEIDGILTANHIHGNIAGSVYLHVKNTSGVTIPEGSPVYATGSVGASGETEIAASDASTAATMPALGITQSELVANAEGHATILGVIGSLDTSTYVLNDSLYVAPGGGLTDTRPTALTDLVQKIGRVVRSDASTGEILVLGAGRSNDVPNNVVAGGLTIDTDTLHVDSTNNRVGIGTTTPAQALDVAGNIALTGEIDGPSDFTVSNGQGEAIEFSQTDNATYLKTVGTNRLTINSAGRVGIGTTSPGSPLHLFGAGNAVDQIRISSTGGTVSEYGFLGADASTNVMRYGYWTGSGFGNHHFEGNVGIGTTTPDSLLEIKSSRSELKISSSEADPLTNHSGRILFENTNISDTYDAAAIEIHGGSDAARNGSITFLTNPNGTSTPNGLLERMIIDELGNVGIGTTTPSAQLTVQAGSTGTDDGTVEFHKWLGSASSPTETEDWPTPVLALRSYDNFSVMNMLSFGYPQDAVYQTGGNVWSMRLSGVSGATSSSSSTNLQVVGPGTLDINSPVDISGAISTLGSTMLGVRQVLASHKTGYSLTGTTEIDTGLSVTITPKSTSSKILVFWSHAFYISGACNINSRLKRGATQLQLNYAGDWGAAGNGTVNNYYLDSPNTTSAVTYDLYARTGSGTLYAGSISSSPVFPNGFYATATEIAQ